MAVWSDRLQWVKNYMSYAEVSRQTAVPYRVVLNVKNSGVVPDQFKPEFNSFWGKSTYSIARSEGVPVYAASAIRGGSVSTIQSEIDTWNLLYDKWATGATGMRYRTFNTDNWSLEAWQDFYYIRNQIVESSQKSARRANEAQTENLS